MLDCIWLWNHLWLRSMTFWGVQRQKCLMVVLCGKHAGGSKTKLSYDQCNTQLQQDWCGWSGCPWKLQLGIEHCLWLPHKTIPENRKRPHWRSIHLESATHCICLGRRLWSDNLAAKYLEISHTVFGYFRQPKNKQEQWLIPYSQLKHYRHFLHPFQPLFWAYSHQPTEIRFHLS